MGHQRKISYRFNSTRPLPSAYIIDHASETMSNKVDACHANSSSCLKSSSTFQAESVLETFLDVQLSFAYAFGYPMAVPLTLNQSCIAIILFSLVTLHMPAPHLAYRPPYMKVNILGSCATSELVCIRSLVTFLEGY